ncbi:MAG TPA: TIGR02996 domain-containing protein [Kofleriaceae bacterium]
MPLLETLLARIVAHPDDEAARAVYADALCEAGDPRGELIQVELALARLGLETMDDLVFSPLEGEPLARATQLVTRALALRPDSSKIRRGFTTTVQSSNLDDIARAIESSPIDTIVPEGDFSVANLRELPLANIRGLYLRPPLDPQNIPALFARMPRLERLWVQVAIDTSQLEPCEALRELEINAVDVETLGKLPCARTLQTLRLSRCPGSFGIASRLPALETLEISYPGDLIADRLPRTLVLGKLPRPEALAAVPALADVEALELGRRDVPPAALLAIFTSPYLRAAKRIKTRDPGDDRAFRALAASPAPLESLDLETADLSADTLAAIVGAHRLIHLGWDTATSGAPAFAKLAHEPAAASLRSLSLFGAYLGDAGAATLAASPYLATLRRLRLGENAIFSRGRAALASMRNVIDLDLSFNEDTDYHLLCAELSEDGVREVIAPYFELDGRGGFAGGITTELNPARIAAYARMAGISATAMLTIPRSATHDALAVARALHARFGGALFDAATA